MHIPGPYLHPTESDVPRNEPGKLNFSKWSRSEGLPSSFTENRKFLKLLVQLWVFQPFPEDGEEQTWVKKYLNHPPPCGAIQCEPAGETPCW